MLQGLDIPLGVMVHTCILTFSFTSECHCNCIDNLMIQNKCLPSNIVKYNFSGTPPPSLHFRCAS